MNPDHTHIVVVLDASGSMAGARIETIVALNHFVADQRLVKGTATISLVQFAYVPSYIWRNLDLATSPVLTEANYAPTGGTALLDAIGSTIDDTGRYLRGLAEGERPAKVVFLTMTDGMENSSHGYSKVEIAAKIKHQQDKYQWQFLFLGADMVSINEARAMGYAASSTMSWEPQVVGGVTRGMVANNVAVFNYRTNITARATYEGGTIPVTKLGG